MLKNLKKLCTPARIYFVMSFLSLIIMSVQNLGNVKTYCVGNYIKPVDNVSYVFITKSIYILIWTWILNKLCSSGYSTVSWLLVLFPFILMFTLIGMFILL